jgi:iron complex outermembrane recepter protein
MAMHAVVGTVTLTSTPALITRQRQNVAESRSRGLEIEGDWRIGNRWRVSSGYLLSDAVVTAGSLEGKRLPQVPRHQVTAQAMFTSPLTIGVQARWSGMQFDDDQNALPLRGFFVADVFASHTLIAGLDATVAAENVFDRRIEASASPVITLGQPRAVRFGLRWKSR